MKASEWANVIARGEADAALLQVYRDVPAARVRCTGLLSRYVSAFTDEDVHLYSAPGRTEVGGNHTDHNHGTVLAAAVELDMLACATPLPGNRVELISEGFAPIQMDLSDLSARPEEESSSGALIRGVAAGLVKHGYRAGGFRAYVVSDVLRGSGLSSSAAFEVLLCCIQNHLYNAGAVSPTEAAIIGRYAENEYFKKPCGLMDQMACATGGFIKIDFRDPLSPAVTPIPAELRGYAMCVVDTHGNHEGLNDEYASLPRDMRAVARALGGEVLRDVTEDALYQNAARVRASCGDRAFLRAAHFFRDNARVEAQACALLAGDIPVFLGLVNESGRSSFMYLQNVFLVGDPQHQPVAAALLLSEHLLRGRGAFRVHGGGFAGTIQAWVPLDLLEEYRSGMDAVFGAGSCAAPGVRPVGITRVL